MLSTTRDATGYLKLKKSLLDQSVKNGSCLILREDRKKADDSKKTVRKKKLAFPLIADKKVILSSFLLLSHGLNLLYQLNIIDEQLLGSKTPGFAVKSLRNHPSIIGLLNLQASLQLSNSWFEGFIKEKGLSFLFELLCLKKEKLR
jgi:hypothetical protein